MSAPAFQEPYVDQAASGGLAFAAQHLPGTGPPRRARHARLVVGPTRSTSAEVSEEIRVSPPRPAGCNFSWRARTRTFPHIPRRPVVYVEAQIRAASRPPPTEQRRGPIDELEHWRCRSTWIGRPGAPTGA